MPLRHLIALIINTHLGRQTSDDRRQNFFCPPSSVVGPPTALIRKTSLLRIVPTACGQAADIRRRPRLAPRSMPGDSAPPVTFITIDARSDPTSSRCQIARLSRPCGMRRRGIVFSTDELKTPAGGARRDRTDDLLLAKQALSQLSYGPAGGQRTDDGGQIKRTSVVCRPHSVV